MRRSVSQLVAIVTQLVVAIALAPTDGLKW
jgi:hypothetical protein